MPVAFIAAVGRRARVRVRAALDALGLELRAVGSDETRAHRLGARVNVTQSPPTSLCSLFAAAGGIMLASQVGIGDASRRRQLHAHEHHRGRARRRQHLRRPRLLHRRALGAVLIQEIVTSTTFLQIGTAWQYYLPGILILVGAGIYSRTRTQQGFAIGAETAPAPQ